jgi:hypothetical protein
MINANFWRGEKEEGRSGFATTKTQEQATMTSPAFTKLPPSSKKEIAMQALRMQGQHGGVSVVARKYLVKRQHVYKLRKRAVDAIDDSFKKSARGDSFTLEVSEADIARTLIALRVAAPCSIRDMQEILRIIYKKDWSYGKTQALLGDAAKKARESLRKVELNAIKNAALDEVFSQGSPILGGIDLDHQYLFLLEACPDRSGDEWAKNLRLLCEKQKLLPDVVVKDAGSGLAKGVATAWPKTEQRDDLFHAVYAMGKEAAHLERRAYGAIANFYRIKESLVRPCKKTQQNDPHAALLDASQNMEEKITLYDRFESLRRDALKMLTLIERGSGRLRTSQEVVTALVRVGTEMKLLGGKRIEKVATYLTNRAGGLGKYLDSLHKRLQEIMEPAGGPERVSEVMRAYEASLQVHQEGPSWDQTARRLELESATKAIRRRIEENPDQIAETLKLVLPLLAARHRASSAIENLNSVLRPYLTVQKHVSQDFLDLFRFYWNTRTMEWGRNKGKSALELLTGTKVPDWLTLLGYPPGSSLS